MGVHSPSPCHEQRCGLVPEVVAEGAEGLPDGMVADPGEGERRLFDRGLVAGGATSSGWGSGGIVDPEGADDPEERW